MIVVVHQWTLLLWFYPCPLLIKLLTYEHMNTCSYLVVYHYDLLLQLYADFVMNMLSTLHVKTVPVVLATPDKLPLIYEISIFNGTYCFKVLMLLKCYAMCI